MASAQATNLLKRLYPNGVAFAGYKKSKFLSMVKKDTSFGGEGRYTVVSVGPTSGGSADFQTAYANQDATTNRRFFVEHKTEYQVGSITGKALRQCKGDKNRIVEVYKHETDKAGYAFGRSLAQCVWGNGGGALGTTATTSGTTITLVQRADIVRFEVGMWLQFASDNGTGTSPAGLFDTGKMLKVTGVNSTTGALTLSADISTVSGVTGTFFIFRAGDYSVKMTGVPGIIPAATISGSDSFRGVNRSEHRNRLGGVYVSSALAGGTKTETLINAVAEGQLHGADGDAVFVNSLDFADILKEQVSKEWVDAKTTVPNLSFKGLMLSSGSGDMLIHSEGDVPRGSYWILNMGDWTLRTAGECPSILNEDENGGLMRVQNADAYQFRLGAYGDLDCDNPGNQIVGSF